MGNNAIKRLLLVEDDLGDARLLREMFNEHNGGARHIELIHVQSLRDAKICLRTKAIVGAEALIRWAHPTRGSLPPTQFIPIAEDCGLIVPIGNWVLREACKQGPGWMPATRL